MNGWKAKDQIFVQLDTTTNMQGIKHEPKIILLKVEHFYQ